MSDESGQGEQMQAHMATPMVEGAVTMSGHNEQDGLPATIVNKLRVAEYTALRAELRTYFGMQSRLLNLTLIVAGGIFTISVNKEFQLATFAYPPLAMFLAASWVWTQRLISLIGQYLRQDENAKSPPMWEHHFRAQRDDPFLIAAGAVSVFGLFVGTQLLAFFWSIVRVTKDDLRLPLLVLDIVAIVITCLFLGVAAIRLDTGLPRLFGKRT